MSKNVIFCYSGTGNCLDYAKNVAKELGDTDIVMVRKAPEQTDFADVETVGFVFPCFGGGAPSDFIKHVKMLKLNPNAYTYGVSMSASYAGIGLWQLNELVPLTYWKTTHHQCSCIWLFPHHMGMPPMSAKMSQKLSEKSAKKVAADVKARKTVEKKPSKAAFNTLENKAWPKMSLMKAKKFKVSDACIGCGQCARLCPRGNIKIVNGKSVIGTDCQQCLGCLQYCPNGAISIGKITDKREHYHNVNVKAEDLMESIIHID